METGDDEEMYNEGNTQFLPLKYYQLDFTCTSDSIYGHLNKFNLSRILDFLNLTGINDEGSRINDHLFVGHTA